MARHLGAQLPGACHGATILDVVVIGGGAVGLCCGYGLLQEGASVAIVEAREPAAGASQGNLGWITPTLSAPLAAPGVIPAALRATVAVRDPLGVRPALSPAVLRWLWQFLRNSGQSRFREGLAALVTLAEQALGELDRYRVNGVAFEMHHTGLLAVSVKPGGLDWLLRLFDELTHSGYTGQLETLSGDAARDREPALGHTITGAAFAATDRHVRPESLCQGLAAYLRDSGVEISTGRAAQRLYPSRDQIVIETSGGRLASRSVVLATGVSTNELLRPLGVRLPIIGAKGYSVTILGTREGPRSALYLSEAKVGLSPYQGATRIGGFFELGARSTLLVPRRIEQLLAAPRPYLQDWCGRPDDSALQAWAGLRPSTPDSLPFIGAVPGVPNLYVAAGHGMLGLTLAPATGALLAGLIVEGNAPAHLRPFAAIRRGQ